MHMHLFCIPPMSKILPFQWISTEIGLPYKFLSCLWTSSLFMMQLSEFKSLPGTQSCPRPTDVYPNQSNKMMKWHSFFFPSPLMPGTSNQFKIEPRVVKFRETLMLFSCGHYKMKCDSRKQ